VNIYQDLIWLLWLTNSEIQEALLMLAAFTPNDLSNNRVCGHNPASVIRLFDKEGKGPVVLPG